MKAIFWSALAGVSLGAACAGSAGVDRARTFLTNAPPPADRTCYAASAPATLPAARDIADSGAIVSGARVPAGGGAGYALFSLRFDAQGQLASLRVIETNLSADRSAAITQLTQSHLRALSEPTPWSVRLKVTSDSAPVVLVGRSELCPAVASGPVDIVTSTTTTSARSRRGGGTSSSDAGAAPPATPHFSVLVDSTGQLLQLKLTNSSGDPSIDEQWESGLRSKPFRPTLLDGAPIVAWTQIPVGG